ncbi:related to O-methyltransferase [Phialocephala subalpina]|uniref:Related to O-methyltransferase n=1 Tax=Phialocephala subalpina TaxID=576137 RepID=A0A1L7X070_9HELO|nr:related to O-methyltransferase [Phialocephala subalpina]
MDVSKKAEASSSAHQAHPHPSKSLVEESYNSIAQRYLDWTTSTPSPRTLWLEKLLSRISSNSNVLELGCGAGVPCTQLLVRHCSEGTVTGVDISATQLELAKKHVPGAKLLKNDMMNLEFKEGSFDGVVGFYSLVHLPREEQGILMKSIRRWLKDEGLLLVNLAVFGGEGSYNSDWLGGGMFWSAWDEGGNMEMMKTAGFDILDQMVINDTEDGREVPFLWVLARKSKI